MSVPFGPEPGPGEVRLEVGGYAHVLLAKVAQRLEMNIENCFWHVVCDGWEVFRQHQETTVWVALPGMAEPQLVPINCCGGLTVRYPDEFIRLLGVSRPSSRPKIGFTGALDETTDYASQRVAGHLRSNETDAYNVLLYLGLAVRLAQLFDGNSYLRNNTTGEMTPIDLPDLP